MNYLNPVFKGLKKHKVPRKANKRLLIIHILFYDLLYKKVAVGD